MIIVSACLAGINCKYDGGNNKNIFVEKIVKEGKAVPVCPEVLGGMETPRIPCEIVKKDKGKRVINREGYDFTDKFKKGAEKTLQIAKVIEAETAILKAKSPSCGFGEVYDGTFSGQLVKGNGFTASLLLEAGIDIYNENEIEKLINEKFS